MKNKYLRISLITLGIIAVLFLLGNFGVNWWLKNNLPHYIKNNSDYKVGYQSLDVDLGTGNIFATRISVASKNPQNRNVIGLDGSIDTIQISRLGIYDAVFRKRISTSDLMMTNPNLKITLAKPIDEKTGKERNPVVFDNLRIKNGNITILRHTQQKYLSVNDLNLDVTELQMTEKSVEKKLPVVFDKYDIQGKNFFFRPDNIYALKANEITTKNGLMNIKNFRLVPLLSFEQFRRYFPKKRNLFDFKASELDFKDIVLKENKVSLSSVNFKNPDLRMYTSETPTKTADKDFKYEVNLEDVKMERARVEILKPNKKRIFYAGSLDLNISKLYMDEETAKGNIPFSYNKFLIGGKDLNFLTNYQDVSAKTLAINPKSIESRGVVIKPLVEVAKKPLLDLTLQHVYATFNSWKLENNKLQVDVQNIVLDALNGTFTAPENEERKKMSLGQLMLPLKVKNITLKNSNLVINRPDKPLVFNNLNANMRDIEMNSQTVKRNVPFQVGSYSLTTQNFNYGTKFYNFSAGLLKIEKDNFVVNNFAMRPKVSRSEFIRMIPVEKDLYNLSASQISGKGVWDLVSEKQYMNISNILLTGVNANIFRSKIPKDDPTIKPMYSELLRNLKFPLHVNNLDVKNSVLVYEEDTKQSEGPGKLTFGNFNMNVKNLNSGAKSGTSTAIPINISCSFMNASPMNVRWNIDTASMNDSFTIAGNISDLAASRINPFIEPYLNIRATGDIQDLVFDFKGNKAGLNGLLNMKHQDLRISILKKETGEKNKILSAIANMVVRTNSERFPESVVVDNVKRDATKSFFNLFWQGIQEGLKKTLIGKNVEKTEETVRNTIKDVKSTVKDAKTTVSDTKTSVKETKENVKDKVQNAKEGVQETTKKSKGLFNKLFKKK